ncbi:MAG: 4Fe-4S binding protein [Eubacteriales bacterium]|nr:4Fe-4S binding protein [Eubacteriales bacterium]
MKFSDFLEEIGKPVCGWSDGSHRGIPDLIKVRVRLNRTLSDEEFSLDLRRHYSRLKSAVTEAVLCSEELADYELPRCRLQFENAAPDLKARALEYTFTISKIKIRSIKLVVFSPTGSSMEVAKMTGGVILEGLRTLEAGVKRDTPNRSRSAEFTTERGIIDLCAGQWGGVGPRTLCIFSVPCYGGRIPQLAAERLTEVKGDGTPAIVCVTYGNRAYEDALLELADLVTENGFHVIAGCAVVTEHNIMHEYGKGRPNAEDQVEIRAFAERVLQRIREGQPIRTPVLPGNRPYKEWAGMRLPIAVDQEKCTDCGVCAKSCPAGAVRADGWKTDENKCINCMRCIKYCPAGCRHVPEEVLRAMTQRLRPACGTRKENAFFVG